MIKNKNEIKKKSGQAMVEYTIIASSVGLCLAALWGVEIKGDYTTLDIVVESFEKMISYISFVVSFPLS